MSDTTIRTSHPSGSRRRVFLARGRCPAPGSSSPRITSAPYHAQVGKAPVRRWWTASVGPKKAAGSRTARRTGAESQINGFLPLRRSNPLFGSWQRRIVFKSSFTPRWRIEATTNLHAHQLGDDRHGAARSLRDRQKGVSAFAHPTSAGGVTMGDLAHCPIRRLQRACKALPQGGTGRMPHSSSDAR